MLNFKKALVILAGLSFVTTSLYLGRHTLPFKLGELLRESSPVRIEFENYSKSFDDEFSFYVLVEMEDAFSELKSFEVLESIHLNLRRRNIVSKLRSLNSEEFLKIEGDFVRLHPFISESGKFSAELKTELNKEFLSNTLISRDGRSLLVSGDFRSFKDIKDERKNIKKFLTFLNQLESQSDGLKIHAIGTKVAQYYYFLDTIKNQVILTPILFLSLALLILFLFKSLKVLFLFSFVMLTSYAGVIGLIVFMEGGVSPYSGFAMFFILVVATSDLVHYFSVYLKTKTEDPLTKIDFVKSEIYTPCLLTSITTAISFLSLIPNSIVPVSNLGIYASFGTLFCFLLTFYLLPALIKLFDLRN
ncbi:MAG: putative RND superfamily exporter protein, partial [Bacteriovoracaceae bacterium]